MSEARARTNSSCAEWPQQAGTTNSSRAFQLPKNSAPMLAVEAMKRQVTCQSVTPTDPASRDEASGYFSRVEPCHGRAVLPQDFGAFGGQPSRWWVACRAVMSRPESPFHYQSTLTFEIRQPFELSKGYQWVAIV